MYQAVLFGLPTVGKSTLSYLAASKLSLLQINVGQLLRETEYQVLGIREKLARGEPINDDIVISLVRHKMENIKEKGFILDGFPRNLKQFAFFDSQQRSEGCCFILLDMDIEKVRSRFLQRLNCPKCFRAVYLHDSIGNRYCPGCGGKLIKRSDDTLEALNKKLIGFNKNEKPLIQYLKDSNRLLYLPVKGNTEHDLKNLLELLYKYKKSRRCCYEISSI